MIAILVNPQAPERLRIRISNPAAASEPLDLTTVTAVVMKVRHTMSGEQTWAADILSQEANLLLLEHVWALGEVSYAGSYRIDLELTVPAGVRRAGPLYLPVTA